jgi:adenylosuccinate synthase
MSDVIVVVGIQWGDEGKGKIVDILSERADFVVRSQGGNNAGHTIVTGEKEYKFHLIPSGILYPNVRCCVAGGCVVDPESLIFEIKDLERQGFTLEGRFHLSAFAHLIMPYHKDWDLWQEEMKGAQAIGTTRKGIGPCYADKANRIGIQVGELLDMARLEEHVKQVVKLKNREVEDLFKKNPIDEELVLERFKGYASFLKPYISHSVELDIAEAIESGKKVLLEGAHGSYLDQTFGTYPYVTSASSIASGIVAGAAIGPTKVNHVLGIVKAFTTRVGHGPFPSELKDEEVTLFLNNEDAREVATTTMRKRRIGWFDAPLVRQSLRWSGTTSMAIMKLDVLDNLKEIKVCIAYRLDGKLIDVPPAMTGDWDRVEPVYEILEGWQQSTRGVTSYEDLPVKAIEYLKKIEGLCKCPISFISYGPEREKTILINRLF